MVESTIASVNLTRDLTVVPPITFGFVEETINKSSASLGAKEVCRGYKYFSETYINDIRSTIYFS